MQKSLKVGLSEIQQAEQRLKGVIRPTIVEHSSSCSSLIGTEVFLKFENHQFTGSFKLRGAYNKISQLSPEEKSKGIIASSAGNHAQGVAYSAQKAGVRSVIVMPTRAPLVKVTATRSYGSEVVLHGDFYDEAFEKAQALVKDQGLIFIPAYEDPDIIAGQGTIGLEILRDLPHVDSVIVPIGGGGLMSGVATAIKALRPSCRVYGVQSDQAPGMRNLFHPDTSVSAPDRPATIADGIAVKKTSPAMFENYISHLVDDIAVVSDDEIAEALVFLMERAKTVTEGSAAAALAAVIKQKTNWNLGSQCCVILSGGNVDLNIISKVIQRGLVRKGRLTQLLVVVDDFPGQLSRLTAAIADAGGNILEVQHDRMRDVSLRETKIEFLIETTGFDQVESIKNAFLKMGVRNVKSL